MKMRVAMVLCSMRGAGNSHPSGFRVFVPGWEERADTVPGFYFVTKS